VGSRTPEPASSAISGLLGTALLPDGQLAEWGDTLEAEPFSANPLNQESCYRAGPTAGHRSGVLAFPAPTPSGSPAWLPGVWAALASGLISTCGRLFSRPGDSAHRHCDLFGLSLSWSLMPRAASIFLELSHIPLWSSEKGPRGGPEAPPPPRIARVRRRAGADRQPNEPLGALFRCLLLGDAKLRWLPAFIDAVQAHREAPRASDCEPWRVPRRLCAALYAPRYSSDGSCWASSRSQRIPARVAKQTWRGNTLSHSMVDQRRKAPGPRSTNGGKKVLGFFFFRSLPGARRFLPGPATHPAVPHPQP